MRTVSTIVLLLFFSGTAGAQQTVIPNYAAARNQFFWDRVYMPARFTDSQQANAQAHIRVDGEPACAMGEYRLPLAAPWVVGGSLYFSSMLLLGCVHKKDNDPTVFLPKYFGLW